MIGALAALLLGADPLTWSGRLYSELVGYTESPTGEHDVSGGFGFDVDVTVHPVDWLALEFSPRLYADFGDPSRSRVLPRRALVRADVGPASIAAGLQRITWGATTLFRPTDVLNQADFGGGFFRGERLADLALSTKLVFEPVLVELVWMPVYQHPRYPGGTDVLGVSFGQLGALRFDVREGFLTEDVRLETMAFGARVRGRAGPVDLEAVWMSGPSRLPGPFLDDLTLRDLVYPTDLVGGSINAAVGPVVLRGELAWTFTSRAPLVIAAKNPYPWTEPIPGPHGAYVVGAETTFWDFAGDADLTLTIEYLGEIRDYLDAQAVFRPWQNDLFVALSCGLDDVDESRISVAAAVDLSRGDTMLRVSAERRLVGDLTGTVEALFLIQGEDGPLDLIHSLADRDTVRIRVDYAF